MASVPKPRSTSEADGAVGLPAREAALLLVREGLSRRGGFDEALARPAFARLEPRDRAWARGLAATVFRRLGPIDEILGARLQRPPPDRVMDILRLGLAQLLFRDTPAFAAVATSVDLAQADKASRAFKGLVNGVLRTVERARPEPPAPEAHVPSWLFARWRAAYGVEGALAIAAAVGEEPATDLSLKEPSRAAEFAALLEGEALPGGTVRMGRRGEIHAWPGYEAGDWWVQDAAAAIPARLLATAVGETALDLCAAPGGKTLQLAATGARVVALDRSAARLGRLKENLARTGLSAEVVTADAADWSDPRAFDAVLLDAPCTATGTFRRHPDVLWAARPAEVAKLAAVQARLLDAAAARVRSGGRLVYCVCSLEPEEGPAQAAGFLARHPEFRAAPVAVGEAGAPDVALTPEGWVRTTPAMGMDGFFIARFAKA